MAETDVQLQRAYYERTAASYDTVHLEGADHDFAAGFFLSALARFCGPARILDIGAGTGRFQRLCAAEAPAHAVTGLEPSPGLRAVAAKSGVALVDGDATALPWDEDSFDFCTEFGALHHIRDNPKAVAEMCRVAARGILISDTNNYGIGSPAGRAAKLGLRALRLWPLFVFLQTRGKMYKYSEGDGVYYSFSIFDILPVVRRKFPHVRLLAGAPTASANLLYGCPQVVVLATRDKLVG